MPKIFCFSNVKGGGDGIAVALAEDGTVLGTHWCSHEMYIPHDLGVNDGARPDRHEIYKAHYPQGYEMEFVPAWDVLTHKGLQAAVRLNQRPSEAAENSES